MKTTLYTNIVLSLIAVLLAGLLLQNFNLIPVARALPLNYQTMDVKIVGVKTTDEMPVDIKNPTDYGSDAIQVHIER